MLTSRDLARETLVAVAVLLVGSLVWDPVQAGLGAPGLHPIWLAVLVLTVRYGDVGLLAGLPVAWAALLGTALALGVPAQELPALAQQEAPPGVLVGLVLAAWVASSGVRRQQQLQERYALLEERHAREHKLVEELHAVAEGQQERAARMELSLSFLRNVAQRLDGADPAAAARAALELAVSRLGAPAAAVLAMHGRRLQVVESTGAWASAWSSSLCLDHTALAAWQHNQAVRAQEVMAVSCQDSSLAAPLRDARGCRVGVLVVRGLRPAMATAAAQRDLAVVAEWCGPALARRVPAGGKAA